ncbi:hypothetical protein SteCoe_2016 [Stentor coeruleus]|uniref:TROVE domain-containing protein n=1 Tax=Stentor coeruleus TaxID=5963 RepID=A0A1R2D0C3_9CILI|nr:hypothetical protein SteCoe_2016 [Stentor coeruleus]
MEICDLIGSVSENPFKRLVMRIATFMQLEPNFYETSEERLINILQDLDEVYAIEPEFIVKLAYYSRNELNLRSTSNFLAAWCASKPLCRPFLYSFFPFIINLPSDLLDFVQQYQLLTGSTIRPIFPSFLQTLIKRKFRDFSIYQLGKYCSEGKRKRLLVKNNQSKKIITMKLLVKLCHIKHPSIVVASIIGKKYPNTIDEFLKTNFADTEDFDSNMAGKRMKIPTPITWETIISAQGNKAECWEELIKSNKLPFMATLRNLRNLLLTGVDEETHNKIISKLKNPDVISNSRLFPFRFLSAYESIKIDLSYLQKLKDNPDFIPPELADNFIFNMNEDNIISTTASQQVKENTCRRRDKRLIGNENIKPKSKSKIIIPKIMPTESLLEKYKDAIDEAIKLATAMNVNPIRGHSVIFCDCSGSMSQNISCNNIGSIQRCQDVGFLFGLMLRHVCESCELYLLSSPKPEKSLKCWLKAEVQGDNIFDLLEQMNELSTQLGGGSDFPFDWFEDIIRDKVWIDNLIIFTDMMLSELGPERFRMTHQLTSFEIVKEYRDKINPNLRYILVDLAGYGRTLGAEFENDYRNLIISGYSDSILKLINFTGSTQDDVIRACKPIPRKDIEV